MLYILLAVLILPVLSATGDQYIFIEDTTVRYYHHIGSGIYCEGTLTQKGVFKADIDDLGKALEAHKNNVKRPGPFPPNLIEARTSNEKVYEYRSGVLAPMIIDEKQGLIPEVGGDIIEFKAYAYSPTARRIYNLPGRFVPKVEKK